MQKTDLNLKKKKRWKKDVIKLFSLSVKSNNHLVKESSHNSKLEAL